MKIMFMIDSNLSGGAERVMSVLANYFAENDHDVILLNFDRESHFYPLDLKIDNIKLCKKYNYLNDIKNKYVKKLNIILKARKEIADNKPDIVVPFLFDAEFAALPFCVRKKIKCVTSVRNDAEVYPFYQRLFRSFFYPKISGVVFQSKAVREHRFFSSLTNTKVIPNPVSNKLYYNRDLGIVENKIISVGRLTKQKNHELIISAIGKLVDKYPDLKLHIFGDGELKDYLQELIRKLCLENNVYLEGVMNDAIEKNRNAQLFVLSSYYEGFPNVLLEAMACHIPVICTDFSSGTSCEALDNGKLGWLIKNNNLEELCRAIEDCINNPEKAEEKAKLAVKKCENYSVSSIGKEWEDFFYKLNK